MLGDRGARRFEKDGTRRSLQRLALREYETALATAEFISKVTSERSHAWPRGEHEYSRVRVLIAGPVSWENGDPQNRGPPSPFYREYGGGDPDFPGKMGTRVPILPGIWGPSRKNRDPCFQGKMGMGIPILP